MQPRPVLRTVLGHGVRYCPDCKLPSSAFLPNTDDPRPEEGDYGCDLDSWLTGIDLYNFGFFWEAHEAWEAVWLALPRDSVEAALVRGCIQTAASLVKLRLGNPKGVQKLSQRSLQTLSQAGEGRVLGILVGTWRHRLHHFWAPLGEQRWPHLETFPRLAIASELESIERQLESRRPA